MSLDFYLEQTQKVDVSHNNATHNLTDMAKEAGIYECLWRPDENGYFQAYQLVRPLRDALEDMKANPKKYRQHNPPNGWGSYEVFLQFVERVLTDCEEYPKADIRVSR